MRQPVRSGHCAFPQTRKPQESHDRCDRQGAGNRFSPTKEFSPCPCWCHLDTEEYECGNCGRELREAPRWPNEEDPDEPVFVHIDDQGNAIGEECLT